MLVRHAGLAGRSNLRCKLAQLVAHHVLRHRHLEVILSIVNFEVESDEVGQDGRGAGLRADGRDFVTGFLGPDNGETARSVREAWVEKAFVFRGSYGTMCGPGQYSLVEEDGDQAE
jgi:hypothetical protein